MDGRMAPQDKMECLVKCCKVRVLDAKLRDFSDCKIEIFFLLKAIFEMLSISNDGKPASADEFLPCLIYVCLKERLQDLLRDFSSDRSELPYFTNTKIYNDQERKKKE